MHHPVTKPKHRRKEVPSDVAIEYWAASPTDFPRARTTMVTQPETPLAALMEARPHEDPEQSEQEKLVLHEMISAVIDMLPPIQRYVIELLYIEGLSMRDAEERMARSKTTIGRIRDEALETMRDLMLNNPEVQRRLRP